MFDPHTSLVPRPRPPAPPVADPGRKFVLGVFLIALASATVVVWPRDEPPPVAIVEPGFHLDTDRDDQDAVWAVVVENTGDDAVENAELRFTYRDDDGESDDSQSHTLPPLEPGERRITTGTHSELALQGGYLGTGDGLSGPPVDMTVDVETSSYTADGARPAEIAVDDVWVGWGTDPLDREVLAVTVDPENETGIETAQRRTDFRILLAFRDADDRIIGGRSLVPSGAADQHPPDDGPRQLFAAVEAEDLPADLASIDVQVQENAV